MLLFHLSKTRGHKNNLWLSKFHCNITVLVLKFKMLMILHSSNFLRSKLNKRTNNRALYLYIKLSGKHLKNLLMKLYIDLSNHKPH